MEKPPHAICGRYRDGRLRTRLAPPSIAPELPAGIHQLSFSGGREAQFLVPTGYGHSVPAPLLLLFHGAYGKDGGATAIAMEWASRCGALVLAPKSIELTWDIVRGSCGPDLGFIDTLLAWTLQRYAVDPSRVGVAGFSDGASYALSVGMMNGDLFHDILAFSPGFARTLNRTGLPRIYIAHGKGDPILALDGARRIAQRLTDDGYNVQFQEFEGGHLVPRQIAETALDRFVR
jgi:phospholipase/carboxylesterase